jgi:hypothetical protein
LAPLLLQALLNNTHVSDIDNPEQNKMRVQLWLQPYDVGGVLTNFFIQDQLDDSHNASNKKAGGTVAPKGLLLQTCHTANVVAA